MLAIAGAAGAAAGCAHVFASQASAPTAFALSDSTLAALPELGDDLPAVLVPAQRHRPARLFSVDTPVGELCAHPAAKAVVDRDLPGLTARPEYMFFKHMTLRQLQAASRGRMTRADLARVSADLSAMPRAQGERPTPARLAALP